MIRAAHLAWLRQAWPFSPKRLRVLGEYAGLKQSAPYVLADIMLRGGVGRSPHVPGDPCTTARNIGRRDLAEEILALAGCDPRSIEDLIERKPTGDHHA